MTLPDGKQKGMKRVLEERDVEVSGFNAACMREELKVFLDFSCQLSILEELVTGRGHMCLFLPRFHCELNPIERCCIHCSTSVSYLICFFIIFAGHKKLSDQFLAHCRQSLRNNFSQPCFFAWHQQLNNINRTGE